MSDKAQGMSNPKEEPVTDNGKQAVENWGKRFNIPADTIRMLAEAGYDSLEALELLTEEDFASTNIRRGHQKLVLKGVAAICQEKPTDHGPNDQASRNNPPLASAASQGGDTITGNVKDSSGFNLGVNKGPLNVNQGPTTNVQRGGNNITGNVIGSAGVMAGDISGNVDVKHGGSSGNNNP